MPSNHTHDMMADMRSPRQRDAVALYCSMPCCISGGDAIAYVVARQLQLQPELKFIFDEESATSTSEELGVSFLSVTCMRLVWDLPMQHTYSTAAL